MQQTNLQFVRASSGSASAAQSGSDAEALVRAALDREKSPCSMTYSTVTATSASGGWNVRARLVTRGGPGTATFGVRTGGTTVTPGDDFASEILAGCP